MMDFSEDPVGATGPIPGADYQGYDDPDLWSSDFVTMSGDIAWNEAKGGIGIFGGGTGTITFHFDNWEDPRPFKHFYEELIFKVEIVSGSIYQDFVTPDGTNMFTDSWDKLDALGGGSYRLSIWTEFQPNPPWEEKVFTLSSSTGNIYLISRLDQIHFKLYAAVDQLGSYHASDPKQLSPSDEELLQAARCPNAEGIMALAAIDQSGQWKTYWDLQNVVAA